MNGEKKKDAIPCAGCPDCGGQKVIQPRFSSKEEEFDPLGKSPEDSHIEATPGPRPPPSMEMFVIQMSNRISMLEREAANQRKFNHETYEAISSVSLQCNVLLSVLIEKKVVTEPEIEEMFVKELAKHREHIARMEEEERKKNAGGRT